jgi:hypothetical protein
MRQEAKAEVATLRSEVDQLKKVVDAQESAKQLPEAAPALLKPEPRFVLLWRASCNGFGALDFHWRSDGYANTLTLILDKKKNIFGGLTPLQWQSRHAKWKCDDGLKSFLFKLKNLYKSAARKFALKADAKQFAIQCDSSKWDRNG